MLDRGGDRLLNLYRPAGGHRRGGKEGGHVAGAGGNNPPGDEHAAAAGDATRRGGAAARGGAAPGATADSEQVGQHGDRPDGGSKRGELAADAADLGAEAPARAQSRR